MPQRRAALECDSAQQAHVVGAGRAKAELVVAERQKARQEVERAQQPPVPLGSDDSILALADTFSAKRTAAAGAGATPTRSSAALLGCRAVLGRRGPENHPIQRSPFAPYSGIYTVTGNAVAGEEPGTQSLVRRGSPTCCSPWLVFAVALSSPCCSPHSQQLPKNVALEWQGARPS